MIKIFVNNQEIDFELKEETTLGDVLVDLENWIREQKHFLSEVRVDDHIIDIEDNSYQKKLLNEIATVHCEVLSSVAYAVSVWSELRTHFEPFKELTVQIAVEQIGEISNRLDWVKKIIVKLDQFFNIPEESQFLIQKIKALEATIFQLKNHPQNIKKVQNLLKLIGHDLDSGLFKLNLQILKTGLKEDFSSVQNSLENYIVFLEVIEEKLPVLATAFQKSHIKSALEELPVIIEGLGIFFVINQQLIKHAVPSSQKVVNSRKYLAESLKDFLYVIEEAIKNQDYIETADIIEYEIKEMIPSMKKTLEETWLEMGKKQSALNSH